VHPAWLQTRLFSEEISNEYAAQTMFFQSRPFQLKKARKTDLVWLFLISKKAKG